MLSSTPSLVKENGFNVSVVEQLILIVKFLDNFSTLLRFLRCVSRCGHMLFRNEGTFVQALHYTLHYGPYRVPGVVKCVDRATNEVT